MPDHCVNCSFRGPASIPVGMDVWSACCPVCATTQRLRPEEHYDAERERRQNPSPRGRL